MNCKHEWVRTSSMAPGEARCIQCCQWAVTNARVSKPLKDEEIAYLIQICTSPMRLRHVPNSDVIIDESEVDTHRLVREVEKFHGVEIEK